MIPIKNSNGFGSVIKIKDRPLRKPWKAVVTVGWEVKGDREVQKKKCIGYYATKTEGMAALTDYHRGGIPVGSATVQEVYDKWFAENTWSEATETAYKSAFKHMDKISKRPLKDIRTADLERILDKVSEGMRHTVKQVMKGIYNYAMRHEIVQKDYSALIKTYKKTATTALKKPFTADEINKLWNDGSPIANSVLVAIYSGWRWNELMSFEVDGDCMVGGSKTKAGKNRMVPIHHKIKPLLDDMYRTASYDEYRKQFDALMHKYKMEHTPHETRHTTATLLYGQDEHLVKLIMGHAEKDITKKVYTHNTIEQLKCIIECIKV